MPTPLRPIVDAPSGLDPADWPALRRSAHAMLDDALDHMQTIAAQPVWREPPATLRAVRRSALPRRGAGLESTHEVFRREVLPYHSGNAHPGFMGWVQGAGSPAGMLAEMLAAAMNANCGGRDHMAIEVEREVLGWTREIFDFPDDDRQVGEGLLDAPGAAAGPWREALHDERLADIGLGDDEVVDVELVVVLGIRNRAFQGLLDLDGDALA